MGRRVRKKVYTYTSNASWGKTSDTLFVYDGWNLIQELDGMQTTPAVKRSYVWGLDLSQSLQGAGGIGGLLAMTDGTDTYLYCHDANGNVGRMVNAADSTVAAAYEYAAFGGIVHQSGGAVGEENSFRFSTKYWDDETGMYYYGYRYYSVEIGRWINRDPLGENGGLNLYGFVNNRPVISIDANGLSWWNPLSWFQSEKAKCKKKQKKRKKIIQKLLAGGVGVGTCGNSASNPCCKKITVLIKLPHSCEKGIGGKGLGGHTGIGIGDEYFDYGPEHGVGCFGLGTDAGDQWWDSPGYPWPPTQTDPLPTDPSDIMLDDITSYIDHYAHGLDAFKIEICVSTQEADSVLDWWKDKYKSLGTYWVLGAQCTSTTCDSLETGLDQSANFEGGISPLGLLKDIGQTKHTCGSNKDKNVKIEQIQSETVLFP
jgi:RHS repeat-associated protein